MGGLGGREKYHSIGCAFVYSSAFVLKNACSFNSKNDSEHLNKSNSNIFFVHLITSGSMKICFAAQKRF